MIIWGKGLGAGENSNICLHSLSWSWLTVKLALWKRLTWHSGTILEQLWCAVATQKITFMAQFNIEASELQLNGFFGMVQRHYGQFSVSSVVELFT